MQAHKLTAEGTIPQGARATAFMTALNILDKWSCKPAQVMKILGFQKAAFYSNKKAGKKANLSDDQLERASYILNIHAALRVIFDNPENVYGFMGMDNHNPYFNGATPIELIATGRFGALYEVFRRVDALRGAQW